MIVTFVSQCHGNSLKRTREVLDNYANRIGDNVWQTPVTQAGLVAIKKHLSSTATRSTAVACHTNTTRKTTQVLWVVGRKNAFNDDGTVAINSTQTMSRYFPPESWKYLELVKSLTAVAALFHDQGKSSLQFQQKLMGSTQNGDAVRHEWMSVLYMDWLFEKSGDDLDLFFSNLMSGTISFNKDTDSLNGAHMRRPFAQRPPALSLLMWLVVSHHRVPHDTSKHKEDHRGSSNLTIDHVFSKFTRDWGYSNDKIKNYDESLEKCFAFNSFENSPKYIKELKRWSKKLYEQLPLLDEALSNGAWRAIMNHAYMSLKIGDAKFSSADGDANWSSETGLLANTKLMDASDASSQRLSNQYLDEHLLGVTSESVSAAHNMGRLLELDSITRPIPILDKMGSGFFEWQDETTKKLTKWGKSNEGNGFFGVNIGSTGTGKTIWNAKTAKAISGGKELRFTNALGLRTLTLQTGDEYRESLGLDETELTTIIGSEKVRELHETTLGSSSAAKESYDVRSMHYSGEHTKGFFPDDETLRSKCQLVEAPVLVCTIDHVIGVTENTRSNRHIAPYLRAMSSDLIIDEIDDFGEKDLVAIGRLVHFTAMCGRRVILSSATITPDIAQGLFNNYQRGWEVYCSFVGENKPIGVAWMDEFSTKVENVDLQTDNINALYLDHHSAFIGKRIEGLNKKKNKHLAYTSDMSELRSDAQIMLSGGKLDDEDKELFQEMFFEHVREQVSALHELNSHVDEATGKTVSAGLVRVANIAPSVNLSKYFADCDWGDDTDVRVLTYHANQLMLLRNHQEKYLDGFLKRKKGADVILRDKVVRQHLESVGDAKNVIFILIATPVEEVGRDHDFDWAVIEPSSLRSIIQSAGRVWRHRYDIIAKEPNISILQFNLNGLLKPDTEAVFCNAGFERKGNEGEFLLDSNDMTIAMPSESGNYVINAIPRIVKPAELQKNTLLADLEHAVLSDKLTNFDNMCVSTNQGFLDGCWWTTGYPQQYNPFRETTSISVELKVTNVEGRFDLAELEGRGGVADSFYVDFEEHGKYELPSIIVEFDDMDYGKRSWLNRDIESVASEYTDSDDIEYVIGRYCDASIAKYSQDVETFKYSHAYGFTKIKAPKV